MTTVQLGQYAVAARQEDWTEAFRQAMRALSDQGGGILRVPAGTYRSYPIQMQSNTTLHLEKGAVIRFYDDPEGFPLISGEFEGIPGQMYMPLIYADGAHHVSVTGQGCLDGNGSRWWTAHRSGTLKHPRPYLVCFKECEHVLLEGVELRNSPVWTVHPLACSEVDIRGVRIINPPDSPNTDGIDPNRCRHVRITGCVIDVGDDCIAIKSGTEDTPRPGWCEDIQIMGCRMLHGHGGVVMGSEMSGGIRNVTVSNCEFRETDRGIRLKTRRGRGGTVESLTFENIRMDGVMCPFVFNMFYFCGKDGRAPYVRDKSPQPVDAGTPRLRDIHIRGMEVKGATACAGFFYGLPEMPVEGVTLADITVEMKSDGVPGLPAMMDGCPEMRVQGFFLRNVRGMTARNVTVMHAAGPVWDADAETLAHAQIEA